MPARSKKQQRAAGMALAAKRGKIPKSRLKGAARSMSKIRTSSLRKYAKTKHKGLPTKKKRRKR